MEEGVVMVVEGDQDGLTSNNNNSNNLYLSVNYINFITGALIRDNVQKSSHISFVGWVLTRGEN